MYAAELRAKFTHLTLTAENDEEYWDERLVFYGTLKQHHDAARMEEALQDNK